MKLKTLVIVAMLAPLGACTPNDTGFGSAVRHNVALQVIDPDPQHAGTPIEGGDGVRSAAAIDRYKKGSVKDPVRVDISSVVQSGSR